MKVREKLKAGKPTLGAWLTVGHPEVAEAMLSTQKYDWLAIDMEHASPDRRDTAAIAAVCERYQVTPLIRNLGHDALSTRRLFDLGIQGVIIPLVESPSQIKHYSDELFYPPKGKRGVCLSRINQWGDQFNHYYSEFNPLIIPQIESIMGVENAADIFELSFVDACFVGPYDLSGSLHRPGDFKSPEFTQALEKLKTTARDKKIPLGIHIVHPNIEDLNSRIQEGYQFIAFGTDLICMRSPILQIPQEVL